MKNILLIISILINIGLFIFCCCKTKIFQPKISTNPVIITSTNFEIKTSMDYTSMKNFTTVYIDRNDSIYKILWGDAFQNHPEMAFLIACTYFHVTKDERILEDIEVSVEQLKSYYLRKIKIDDDKIKR